MTNVRPWSNGQGTSLLNSKMGVRFPPGAIDSVTVAQLVRALDCDSGGRGFEPRQSPVKFAERSCR